MDNRLDGQYSIDVAHKVANLALRCISLEPKFRPKMGEIVKEIEQLQDLYNTDSNHKKTRKHRRRSAGDAGNEVTNAGYQIDRKISV